MCIALRKLLPIEHSHIYVKCIHTYHYQSLRDSSFIISLWMWPLGTITLVSIRVRRRQWLSVPTTDRGLWSMRLNVMISSRAHSDVWTHSPHENCYIYNSSHTLWYHGNKGRLSPLSGVNQLQLGWKHQLMRRWVHEDGRPFLPGFFVWECS